MTDPHSANDQPIRPSPPQDHPARTLSAATPAAPTLPARTLPAPTLPERIARVLRAVGTLLGYGRHMQETLEQRAPGADFPAVAIGFGTFRLATIAAQLQRGILRAMALEHVLRERAARGRDIQIVCKAEMFTRYVATDDPAAYPGAAPYADAGTQSGDAGARYADATAPYAGTQSGDPSGTPYADAGAQFADAAAPDASAHAADPWAIAPTPDLPAPPPAAPHHRRSRPRGWDEPVPYIPTLEEMIAEVRRRPVGRTLVEICLDLAVMPGICEGSFWNELHALIDRFGGSLPALIQARMHREKTFEQEQDRMPVPGRRGAWWQLSRAQARAALGFFVGEPPAVPPALLTPATGPP